MIIDFNCNHNHHLQEYHLKVPEMINCDDRQTVVSELTNSISIPSSSISVPDSDLMMSSLTSFKRSGYNDAVARRVSKVVQDGLTGRKPMKRAKVCSNINFLVSNIYRERSDSSYALEYQIDLSSYFRLPDNTVVESSQAGKSSQASINIDRWSCV